MSGKAKKHVPDCVELELGLSKPRVRSVTPVGAATGSAASPAPPLDSAAAPLAVPAVSSTFVSNLKQKASTRRVAVQNAGQWRRFAINKCASRRDFLMDLYEQLGRERGFNLPKWYNLRQSGKNALLVQSVPESALIGETSELMLRVEILHEDDIPYVYQILLKYEREQPGKYVAGPAEAIFLPTSRMFDAKHHADLRAQMNEVDANNSFLMYFHRHLLSNVDLEQGRIKMLNILGQPHREFLFDVAQLYANEKIKLTNENIQFRVLRIMAPQTLPTIAVYIYDDTEVHRYVMLPSDKRSKVRTV